MLRFIHWVSFFRVGKLFVTWMHRWSKVTFRYSVEFGRRKFVRIRTGIHLRRITKTTITNTQFVKADQREMLFTAISIHFPRIVSFVRLFTGFLSLSTFLWVVTSQHSSFISPLWNSMAIMNYSTRFIESEKMNCLKFPAKIYGFQHRFAHFF